MNRKLLKTIKLKVKKKYKVFTTPKSIREIVFLLLLLNIISGLYTIYPTIRKELKVLNPTNFQFFLPYPDKLRWRVGFHVFDFAEFIKMYTTEQAIILIPPQGFPWPKTGNIAYFRYLLYPRTLINGNERDPRFDLKKTGVGYVLITPGESTMLEYDFTPGWPKFSVPAKRIIYKKDVIHVGEYEAEIVESDYQPTPENLTRWGIIEVDRERL